MTTSCEIAIVGMAGRFPGAPNVAAFWNNLCEGTETIQRFDDAEMEDAFDRQVRGQSNYVKARAILDDADLFDAAFFGIHANDAKLIDPQHRVFLECCWEALEDAGYDPGVYAGAIGVYAGCSINTYFLEYVLRDRARVAGFTGDYPVGSYPELLGAAHDFLATRVSYRLNLRGPSMTMQAGCSTSLLTVTQACQTLMLGQADMMLAGGVSVSFPQKRGYLYQQGGMVSADGHCRTFDARASGTVFGDGAGVVVLKRLERAVADGDSIYAVIRGFGMNNDGSDKIGYTAPSVDGQAAAVRAAYRMAGFGPETVGYVECHGTATPLGDPIEIEALKLAFGTSRDETSCILGSVKPNVGHLDIAAGVTGLIKAALAVRSGIIPPTLHFEDLNPQIDVRGTGFSVSAELEAWPILGETRRAGVSAFGVGGSNAHVALESFEQDGIAASGAENCPHVLILSARTPGALSRACDRLARKLTTTTDIRLADVAYTLQSGRRAFQYRCAIVAGTNADAIRQLDLQAGNETVAAPKQPPAIAFMFPGQGAQYVGMGRDLYDAIPAFRAAIDRCAAIAEPLIGRDLRTSLYPAGDAASHGAELRATEITQPALFAVEYALATVMLAWGLEPASMVGHSIGEFVAATLSGVFTLEEGLSLVCARGKLMGGLPGGAMLAVRLPESELATYLDGSVDLAAVNAPGLCVLAGPVEAIERIQRQLERTSVSSRLLHTSHAFHSAMMDPVVEPLAALAGGIAFQAPRVPYVSAVSGAWIDADTAMNPTYWARHCREAVRFADALTTVMGAGAGALLELGPGSTLSTFALQGAAKGSNQVLHSLPSSERERPDLVTLLEAVGRLWVLGAKPNWAAVRGTEKGLRVSLPAYSFDRVRHWVDVESSASTNGDGRSSNLAFHRSETYASHSANGSVPVGDAVKTPQLRSELVEILETISGESLAGADDRSSFLELGFDSLFLGRFVQALHTSFGVTVSFRQLMGELPSIAALAAHLAPKMPAAYGAVPSAATAPHEAATISAALTVRPGDDSSLQEVMRDQIQAMQQLFRDQLEALQKAAGQTSASLPASTAKPVASKPPQDNADSSRFDAFRVTAGTQGGGELSEIQREHIDELVRRTTGRTARSKVATQRHRAVLADPRVAAGFRAEWKEMVYPITCVRAKGSRLWDIDGNEYVDILNGFGQTAFGHAPDFVVDAIRAQLNDGFAIGPQADLAGEAAELFCAITGNERMTFCNTGSEAVMAALRVARTVTGRDRVVMFGGAYHGQFDEVLVKGTRTPERSVPIAPGIPATSVASITVLPYATDEALAWVREHAQELAAVVVEPVQSRHPGLQPRAFLFELRAITAASGSALIFDEVVTGFRVHPGGLQAVFDIRADLATYGKVVGGGMPIGILAGSSRFMDALDGGMWQYGDESQPEVPPTFFAGTFVRHPLTLAAVVAVLKHLAAEGPELQRRLTELTSGLVARLNAVLERRGVQSRIETFGSMFYFNFTAEEPLASLLYYHLRERGVYIQEGFPCFLTTTHTAADVERIVEAFSSSLEELQGAGIFSRSAAAAASLRPAVPAVSKLTEEQKEIWLAAQSGDEASCAFNESITMRFAGDLQLDTLGSSWRTLIGRHDALRLIFSPTGESMQTVAHEEPSYETVDLSGRGLEGAEAELRLAVQRDASTPFDLVRGPLVRAQLFKLAEGTYAFVVTVHHIVCDGWSINLIVKEFAALYSATLAGRPAALPEPMGYLAYARAQQQRDPQEREAIESFWLGQFADPVLHVDLPTDRPRPVWKTYRGSTTSAFIEKERYIGIKQAGGRAGVTLFVTLLATYQLLVARLGESDDIVVGIPAAGQAAFGDAPLVGHCVNFLPVRARLSTARTAADFLHEVRGRVLDAYEHQPYTFGTLVSRLNVDRTDGRVPLTEFQFNLERLEDNVGFGDIRASVEANPKAFVHFDLFFNVIESTDGLELNVDFNTALFDEETIQRWLALYGKLLDAVVRDSSVLIKEMELAVNAAIHPALASGKALEVRNTSIHALIEARVKATPDARAVIFEREELTYRELDNRANQLARHIRSHSFTGRRVGISVSRSIEMLVALLAALKAGYSYVPLDPTHPKARLAAIADEAQLAAMIVDDQANADVAPSGTPVIHLARDRAAISAEDKSLLGIETAPDSPAYLLYTSGSTGKPKGVEITHSSVVNFLTSALGEPGFDATDVLVAVSTISFDIAVLELFLPLSAGGCLALASGDDVLDGTRLRHLATQTGATMLQATPATWRLLIEAGFVARAGFKMLCTGEAMPQTLADKLLESDGELWNMYGPTETTVWSSCARIYRGERITVGHPIANTQCYVLDEDDAIVACEAIGHLHIGGAGVGPGYAYLPELTAERFIANPFGPGRLYRTGDAARIRLDGTIEVLGRLDDQVKLNGYRIELGEVETALIRLGGLRAAAVALHGRETESPRLVAYVVAAASGAVDVERLRQDLRSVLPDYMIPKDFITLEALPVNTNGKLDRRALPAPSRPQAVEVTEPATLLERQLLDIFVEVLGHADLGTTTDIMSLGADSIQIFKIVARANKMGIKILAKDILQKRTVQNVARSQGDGRGAAGQRLSKMPPTRLVPARERQARL